MPRVISGERTARSFVTPTGAANVVSRVLDFQLGPRQGIQIHSVLGYGTLLDASPSASDTVPVLSAALQTLHLEESTTEVPPISSGDDADDIDTEIFYAQSFAQVFQIPATVGGGGGAVSITPNNLVVYKTPVLAARNITHRGTTVASDSFLNAGVLIRYEFVEFSNAELGFLLARRD